MRYIINWKGEKEEFSPNVLGEGWEDIITRLYDDLVSLGWDRTLHQIKEKFGGLRFYIGEGNSEIYDRIDEAERESLRTCMKCGKPGKQNYCGWILTLCEECSTYKDNN